jgi:Uri superfamily endonuclease
LEEGVFEATGAGRDGRAAKLKRQLERTRAPRWRIGGGKEVADNLATKRFFEFFTVPIRNKNTRIAYYQAIG